MKPETKLLLLEVELEMAKEKLIFIKRSIVEFENTPYKGGPGYYTKEELLEFKNEELQPVIERYEKALDAVKGSMELYPNIQGITGVIDTAMPMSDSEFIQSEYRKLAKIQIKNK